MFWIDSFVLQGIRERAKRATANRKPQHAHLMDNLAPHTKRLAETAMGGPPIAGGQQQTVPQTQRVHVTTPAGSGISNSNATDNNAGGSAGGGGAGATTALAGSLLSPPGVTLAKTTLLGRAASMTMGSKQQSRRRSLFDDDKGTDQGSGSQVNLYTYPHTHSIT